MVYYIGTQSYVITDNFHEFRQDEKLVRTSLNEHAREEIVLRPKKYHEFNVTSVVLSMMVIILSLQTKLGEKVSILFDRIVEVWEGPKDKKKGKKGQGNVKVSQPISQNSSAAISQSLGSTSISSLPQQQATQQMPDYNNMYQQDSTPLVGAATPGMESLGGAIMAANDALGGTFGSAFGW
jgi:hypothetical protein